MSEDMQQLDTAHPTDPDKPIGDPPPDTSGGQNDDGGPRPVPGDNR